MINPKLIPRKYRKGVIRLIDDFEVSVGKNNNYFTDWDSFLTFTLIGIEDGWRRSSRKEFQSVMWLLGITTAVNGLQEIKEGVSE